MPLSRVIKAKIWHYIAIQNMETLSDDILSLLCDPFYVDDFIVDELANPIILPRTSTISWSNSKGRRKTDHELREQFYRLEFRCQTGGKVPPAFTPSRSAYDESFLWRPYVNEQFSIDIPLYRKTNGKLDGERPSHRSNHHSATLPPQSHFASPTLHHDLQNTSTHVHH